MAWRWTFNATCATSQSSPGHPALPIASKTGSPQQTRLYRGDGCGAGARGRTCGCRDRTVRERAARVRAVAAEREQSRLREEAQRAEQTQAGCAPWPKKTAVAPKQLVCRRHEPCQSGDRPGKRRSRSAVVAVIATSGTDLRGFDWRYLWTKSRGQHIRSLPAMQRL